MKSKVFKIAKQLSKIIPTNPSFAIILGSGLGGFVDNLENKIEIEYNSLKGMPQTTVKGHKGKFVFGYLSGIPILVMQGRLHLYEGYTAKEVVVPIYVFKTLGIEKLIITNAAGAVNKDYLPGDIMIIKDQINLTGQNPLIAGPILEYGEMFVDMIGAYDKNLINIAEQVFNENQIDYQKGTYIQFSGPTYETPAEVVMARQMGADAVGMSTSVEAIAASQLKMKTLGLSTMANIAVTLNSAPVTHDEVLLVMDKAKEKIITFLKSFVEKASE